MTDPSHNLRSSILMSASMAAYVFNDMCMKALSDELPVFQAIFLRGLLTSLIIAFLAWKLDALRFRYDKKDWKLILLRSLAEMAAAYFFVTAIFNMPIANATAILQALPLTVALAGALFLGEAIGWRRLVAILIGLIGVLLIVQPGTNGFSVYSVYAILTVLAVTIRDLAARRLSKNVPSLSVALIASLVVTILAGSASLTIEWSAPSLAGWVQLIGASVFIIGGYVFSIMTMRIGDIGAVAPFRYTSLIWALLLGFFLFNEWPDGLSLIGAAIVVATGVYTILRERRLTRQGLQSSG